MSKESEWAKKSLSRILAKKVSEYLKKEENRHEFEKWYEKKTERNMFSKLIHRFIDFVILLLTGKGNLAREAVDQGICDFSGQGRDKYGN